MTALPRPSAPSERWLDIVLALSVLSFEVLQSPAWEGSRTVKKRFVAQIVTVCLREILFFVFRRHAKT